MKKRFIVIVVAAFLALLAGPRLVAAETNSPADASPVSTISATNSSEADLICLVTRINAKLKQNQTNPADLADDLKEFDVLFAKHKEATPEDRAHILAMKGQLYLQVLNDPEKALEAFKKLKAEFPTLQINGNSDQLINSLEAMVEKKKIQ